jgi:hypothetical protein
MSRATAAVLLALGLVALSPAAGWASGLELRIGGFFPRGESDLFFDDNELYSRAGELAGVTPNHFDGLYGGVEYSFNVAKKLEMGISIDGYGKTIPTVYRDFTRPDGSEIEQNLRLFTITPGLSLRFLPRDRFATIQPYVTIGADVIFYQYEEFGDFIASRSATISRSRPKAGTSSPSGSAWKKTSTRTSSTSTAPARPSASV